MTEYLNERKLIGKTLLKGQVFENLPMQAPPPKIFFLKKVQCPEKHLQKFMLAHKLRRQYQVLGNTNRSEADAGCRHCELNNAKA